MNTKKLAKEILRATYQRESEKLINYVSKLIESGATGNDICDSLMIERRHNRAVINNILAAATS